MTIDTAIPESPVAKTVEVSTLVEPKFLTLTGLPANQTAFKIVRRDRQPKETKMPVQETTAVRQRRTRPVKRSAVLYIVFPEGTTDEDVATCAEEYGLDGYEVTVDEIGRKCLKRSDIQKLSEVNAMTVSIGNGRILGAVRSDAAVATTQPQPFLSVVEIEFNSTTFPDQGAVEAWLTRNDVDFLEGGIQNANNAITVKRSDVGEAEIRKVQIEEGVMVTVTRADTPDMGPADPNSKFIAVVNEACYGSYGWGHLDFNAALADAEFSEAADEAIWMLRRVMEQIVFYSSLPVSVRKELVSRAATQYAAYIGSLMDALPAQVVLVNRSQLSTKKETDMKTTDASKATPVARTDAPANGAKVEDANTPVTLTRSELAALVEEAVAKRMDAGKAPAETTAEETTAATGDGTGSSDSTSPSDGAENVQRSDKTGALDVEELVKRSAQAAAAAAIESIKPRLDAIEGATIVRSDTPDAKQSVVAEEELTPRQRQDRALTGVLSNRSGRVVTSRD